MGNLTDVDRAAFERGWAENTAEAWARRQAASESVEQVREAVKESLRANMPRQ